MLTDFLKPSGQLKIVLRDKDGNIKSEQNEKNLVVTAGLNYIAARMTDTSEPTDMSHMAVGTGTGALTEAAVLNASSSGTMLCRTVFSAVNKGADDSVTITWTITIS